MSTETLQRSWGVAGRAAEVRELRGELQHGSNLVVVGRRGIGVTTLLELVCRSLDVSVLRVSLAMSGDNLGLARNLVRVMFDEAAGGAPTLARQADTWLLLGDPAQRILNGDDAADDPIGVAFDALERYSGRHAVLWIDDVEELANPKRPFGDAQALAYRLRELAQRASGLTTILSGITEEHLTGPRDAFYQWGSEHRVHEVISADWEPWWGNVEYATAAYSLTEGHTATIVALRSEVESSRLEGAGAVYEAWARLLEVRSGVYGQLLAQIRRSDRLGAQLCERIARDEPPYVGLSRAMVGRGLESLEMAGLVHSLGSRMGWRLTDPLFAEYLRRMD